MTAPAPPPKGGPSLAERAVAAMGGAGAILGKDGAAAGLPPNAALAAAGGATLPPPPPRGGSVLLAEPPPVAAPPPAASPARPPLTLDQLAAAGLVTQAAIRSRLSEEIAVVQHQVVRTARALSPSEGRAERLILVTSARPGEGKTFMSLNIGAAMATASSQPTLVVDVDGKVGGLTDLFSLTDAPGLRRLVAKPGSPPLDVIVPTVIPGLFFLPYGRPEEGERNPIPSGPAIADAVRRLAADLPGHLIVLDSPPALATNEPASLAPVVGQVLMVVQAEQTQRSEVEAALDMVDTCPTLQLVLNQARYSSANTFGAYGYEAYGYNAHAKPRPEASDG